MASKDKRENGSAMDDTEFEKLLDEMDELGRQADALRKKVNYLIDEMRENDVVVDEDADNDASGEAVDGDGDADKSAHGEAVNGDADNDASEEAVDEDADNDASGDAVDADADNNAP